jgi:hypothetical protein
MGEKHTKKYKKGKKCKVGVLKGHKNIYLCFFSVFAFKNKIFSQQYYRVFNVCIDGISYGQITE